jgi:molybdenum cofactor sulfurtransferase
MLSRTPDVLEEWDPPSRDSHREDSSSDDYAHTSVRKAKERFLGANPQYKLTKAIDTLRAREYRRLKGEVYLDYTGAGLYPESLVREHAKLLRKGTFGNPHSLSPS